MANLRRTMPPADGITVRRKSRALFQQHRPIASDAAQERHLYSITSSARASSAGGVTWRSDIGLSADGSACQLTGKSALAPKRIFCPDGLKRLALLWPLEG